MTEATEAAPAAAAVFESPSDKEAAERAAQAVATTAAAPVAADVEAIRALDDGTRRALYGLLSSLADNKYVLGRRYGEWCTGAPMLESAVAAAAMAQDELGHARSFYPLLRAFPEAAGIEIAEDAGWQARPTTAVTGLTRPFAAWTDFVAANLLVDRAFTTLLEAARDATYEPLRQRARKIVQDEAAHNVHAEGWLRRLAANEHARSGLLASIRRVWDDAFTWFGPEDDPVVTRLVTAGILNAGSVALRDRLSASLNLYLDNAGFLPELEPSVLPWDRWDAKGRRLRGGG